MYGTFETHIVGRIANKDGITLRKDEAGKPYCYVRVAVPRRPKANASGEKEEREPIWVDLAVGGTTATYLAQNAKSGMWLKCDAVGIPRTRTEEKNGTKVRLTQVEYAIVKLFMQNPGRPLSREDILATVWGREYEGDLKIVDVNIRRLRVKIEDDANNPAYINTVWGLGYKWSA